MSITTSAAMESLKATLRGELIDPAHPGYDQARALYNAMSDKHPALIARCVDVADVIACVRYAAAEGVELAVRGGGHNGGVVLADGRLVRASEREHDDLFWALRGGGGNFGVVTSFTFQTRPVASVIGGPMLWPLEQAGEVLELYADFIARAPDELNGFFAVLTVPPGPPFPTELHLEKMCGVVWCHTGSELEARAALDPVRRGSDPRSTE